MQPKRSVRRASGIVCATVSFGAVLLAAAMLTGCGGAPGNINISGTPASPTPTPVTTNTAVVAKNVYYCSPGFSSLYTFTANQSGTVTATATLPLTDGPFAVTGDAAGNLYVSSNTAAGAKVSVFAAGATTASKTIQLPTGEGDSTMTIDAAGNLYIASLDGKIFIYGPTATGAATPLRTITGVLVGGIAPTQMAVDSTGNLYAADGGGYTGTQLVEFGPTANGAATPVVLTNSTYLPTGVTLDAKDNIYISQNGVNPGTSNFPSAIYEFAAGSKAGATPLKSIVGSATQLGPHLNDIQVDTAGNIFVEQFGFQSSVYVSLISVFGASANGNVAPASTLIITNSQSTDTQIYLR